MRCPADITGLLLAVLVTGAHVQDRDGGRALIWAVQQCFPTIRLIWAESGYRGELVTWAAAWGLTGGIWHTVLSTHFDAHHPIRVGVLSRHPVQMVADTAAFIPPLTGIQGDDTGHPGDRDGPRRTRR